MGPVRTTLATVLLGATGATSGWTFWTRNSKFIPILPSDPIFSSPAYIRLNPNHNALNQDICQRKVPLSKIKPQIVEKEKDCKLIEAFCAGIFGGYGYTYHRAHLPMLFPQKNKNHSSTSRQIWSPTELLSCTYEVGTEISDQFEVIEKTPTSIVVRCGDSPSNPGVREYDGLFEMKVRVDREEGVAVFDMKSVFFIGTGKTTKKPMSRHMEFWHRLYTKLLMETAVRNCTF